MKPRQRNAITPDAIDIQKQGERAEELASIFDKITVDPTLPRCTKCGSVTIATEPLCMNCKRFAATDRESAKARRRRRR